MTGLITCDRSPGKSPDGRCSCRLSDSRLRLMAVFLPPVPRGSMFHVLHVSLPRHTWLKWVVIYQTSSEFDEELIIWLKWTHPEPRTFLYSCPGEILLKLLLNSWLWSGYVSLFCCEFLSYTSSY